MGAINHSPFSIAQTTFDNALDACKTKISVPIHYLSNSKSAILLMRLSFYSGNKSPNETSLVVLNSLPMADSPPIVNILYAFSGPIGGLVRSKSSMSILAPTFDVIQAYPPAGVV